MDTLELPKLNVEADWRWTDGSWQVLESGFPDPDWRPPFLASDDSPGRHHPVSPGVHRARFQFPRFGFHQHQAKHRRK